jgi:hypothetical protein
MLQPHILHALPEHLRGRHHHLSHPCPQQYLVAHASTAPTAASSAAAAAWLRACVGRQATGRQAGGRRRRSTAVLHEHASRSADQLLSADGLHSGWIRRRFFFRPQPSALSLSLMRPAMNSRFLLGKNQPAQPASCPGHSHQHLQAARPGKPRTLPSVCELWACGKSRKLEKQVIPRAPPAGAAALLPRSATGVASPRATNLGCS